MTPDYLKEILNLLKKNFNVDENAEVTMETNPGTVDKLNLKKFKDAEIICYCQTGNRSLNAAS